MNKTPFRCVLVKNIPAANLRIASLAKHFQYYGDITNITLDEPQHSAVVQFEHSKAAYAAMRSHSAVFKNRFVIVEPLYNPNNPATFEKISRKRGEKGKPNLNRNETSSSLNRNETPTHSSQSTASLSAETGVSGESMEPVEPVEPAMKLVETRQQLQQQEIAVIRSSIQKRLELLQKYAVLATSIAPSEIPKFRSSLNQLLEPLYEEAGTLYELLKTSGIKEDGGEDPESEVKRLLSAVYQLFEDSKLFSELKSAVTSRLYSIFEKQFRQLNRSKRRFSASPAFSKKRRGSLYEIDNRPRSIRIAKLPEGATQDDVAVALKGFFGVQQIDVQASSATISFLQPWQTTKPIRTGLWICNQVDPPPFFLSRKSSPSWFPSIPLRLLPRSLSLLFLLSLLLKHLHLHLHLLELLSRKDRRPLLVLLLVFALCVEQTSH